jgi:nicotinate phosphoribosyltransferase
MNDQAPGLMTDLYELTMAAAYHDNGVREPATFELFVRALPPGRSFLIAAGLSQALEYLTDFRFSSDQIDFLRHQPAFQHVSAAFFEYLATVRFTGDVWAIPEGTAVFANEPLLRITAPIIEAQLVETALLAIINLQTLVASKAARIVTAARGRSVIDFGSRRAHGMEAGVLAARAAYIAGCAGTSNVEAGHRFGIPIFGTLAHSFVMAFDREEDAFRAFLKVFPDTATVLVDTYDTLAAVKMLTKYKPIPAVRLDSGDLLRLSVQTRRCLDEAGMTATKIFASGDLDEHRIAQLVAGGAPIDGFGVGTQLATSYDAPALGIVYKLVSVSRGGRIKLSEEKATYPLAKQVWRRDGEDLITTADEATPGSDWQPLLVPAATATKSLERCRALTAQELTRLPAGLLALDSKTTYPVRYSERLETERRRLADEARKRGTSGR